MRSAPGVLRSVAGGAIASTVAAHATAPVPGTIGTAARLAAMLAVGAQLGALSILRERNAGDGDG